ncbi:MAG: hypothetical protein EP332_06435 [Bacteroidetes bacterium]|nr:MAG: hypothetical protein EP332_06435 [Bacteroidota bacterium]
MESRIQLTPKDLQKAFGFHPEHSRRMIRGIKSDLGLGKKGILTIKAYCEYSCIDLDEFLEAIKVKLP